MQIKFKPISIFVIFGLLVLLLNQCNKTSEISDLYESANDSLSISQTKNGEQIAAIKSFKVEKKNDFLAMKTKDSTIIWLQGVVKKSNGVVAAMVASTSTKDQSSSSTTIVIDSTKLDSGQLVFPIYKTTWDEKWSMGEIIASKDSIQRDITFKNDFQITISNRSNKLFKPKEMTLELINLNPNTQTHDMRSLVVKNEPKRVNLGIQAGYGVDMLTFNPVFYVGFGVGFTLVGVK